MVLWLLQALDPWLLGMQCRAARADPCGAAGLEDVRVRKAAIG